MTFLNPLALWGLLFISIPIIIHLFNFRIIKKIYFSNVALLNSVQSQSESKNTLRKLLVLLLRIMAIIFLIIAFAQPIMDARNSSASVNEGYYLDNSLSMGRKSKNGNDLLADAINVIESYTAFKADNQYIIFTTNDFGHFNKPFLDSEFGDKLSEVRLSNHYKEWEMVDAKLKRMALGSNERVNIFSDFQKASFGSLKEYIRDTTREFNLVKIEALSHNNLYIDSVKLDNPIGLPTKNEIKLLLKSIGNLDRQGVLIKLYKEDIQVSSFSVELVSNSSKWVSIDLTGLKDLSGSYTIEIEDPDFVFDNRYYFVINKFKKAKIYQLFEKYPNVQISSVYSNSKYFDFQTNSINDLDQQELTEADLIVLDHLNNIPEWLVNQLKDHRNAILIFPSEAINLTGYQTLLGSKISLSLDSTRQTVSPHSLVHPFFNSVFNQRDEQIDLPWVKPILDLSSQKNQDVVLKSNLSKSLLTEFGNHIFVFSSPLKSEFTNFQTHGLFLPLMYKISMANRNPPMLAYQIGNELVAIENDSVLFSGNLNLKSNEEVIVPMVRNVKGSISLEIPFVLNRPGFYDLQSDEKLIKTMAFNLPKAESMLEPYTDQEISQMIDGFPNVKFESINDVGLVKEKLASINEGLPLWKYALLLALVFLITELTLLRIFK